MKASKKAALMIAVGFLTMATIPATIAAQQLTINGFGGVSQPISSTAKNWNTGFVIGANGYFWIFDKLGVGGHFGFNRWIPDVGSFLEGIADITQTEIEGTSDIFEIVPSIRARTNFTNSPINVFGQAGFGLFVMRQKATIAQIPLGATFDDVYSDGEWIGKSGFQVGGGVSLGRQDGLCLEICPLYNVVLNGDNAVQYFTGSIGLSIGL